MSRRTPLWPVLVRVVRALRWLAQLPPRVLRWLFTPAVLCSLMVFAAAAAMTAGAYLIFGLAIALIVLAAQLYGLAYLLARGLAHE
jgi:hypothetical protein